MTMIDTPEGIEFARERTLAAALRLYVGSGMIPNRHLKPQRMLELASEITGKSYKRGKVGATEAIADLDARWLAYLDAQGKQGLKHG